MKERRIIAVIADIARNRRNRAQNLCPIPLSESTPVSDSSTTLL
jgi:hypothetical protein